MIRVGVIVLAAGRSTRYADPDGHKLLARVVDAPVVRHAVLAAVNSGVGDVVVVTGGESELVARAVADLPLRVEHEPHFADGMAVSLKRGVETLTVPELISQLKSDIPASRMACVRLPLTVLHTGLLRHTRAR